MSSSSRRTASEKSRSKVGLGLAERQSASGSLLRMHVENLPSDWKKTGAFERNPSTTANSLQSPAVLSAAALNVPASEGGTSLSQGGELS